MTSQRADNSINPSPGNAPPPPRALSSTIRRRALILAAIFCLACSLLFIAAPHLARTYNLAATLQAKVRTFDAIPELAQLPESAIKPVAATANSRVSVSLKGGSQSPGLVTQTIQLATSDSSRDAALDRLQATAGQISSALQARASDVAAAYRDSLRHTADDLAQKNQTLLHDITVFRLAHRGALPDDPTSTLAQFDKLANKLDEKQQRLQIVTQQIKRLQDYQKSQANGGIPSTPPPPLAPAGETAESSRPAHPENDPEVVELTAQLQLLNNQVDEQLNTMHRTEQHPYVVDLRNQQAALQKKLDAARQRAAAGKPPPAAAQALAGGHAGDSASAQTVELQLESLQAEQDALDPEVRSLTAQREGMQKQVDEVLPIRQKYETLNAQLAAVRKDQETQQARTEDFNRQFGAIPPTADDAAPISETSPLALVSASSFPSFPQVPLVYAAGIAIGFAVTAFAAFILRRMDRTFHTMLEATSLGTPILGAVSEIRTLSQQHRLRLWQTIGKPTIAAALFALAVTAAILCYKHLSDPTFGQSARSGGASSFVYRGTSEYRP